MDLKKQTEVSRWTDEKEAVRCALEAPNLFSRMELEYISKRLPFEKPYNLGVCGFLWAKRIGHRNRMASVVFENGTQEHRVRFAFEIDTYKQKMKESISSAKGAFLWSAVFPEDSEEFIDMVQGGKWAFKWAKEIGDEDTMESRISTTFWQMKFDKEVKDDGPVSFSSARN